jgi:2-amino-4-hydroxy-6-hydroxymethyldihydropteridine diphosphokinase
MARVFLSLGSNLGDRRRYLEAALTLLRAETAVRVVTCSQVYETTPWPEIGSPRESWHLNCAVEIETELPPDRLLQLTQAIESRSGRLRQRTAGGRPAPRSSTSTSCSTRIRSPEDQLQIPPSFLHLRRFVLVPWRTSPRGRAPDALPVDPRSPRRAARRG